MRNLRMPTITEATAEGKIWQMIDFLRQLISALNMEDSQSREQKIGGYTVAEDADGMLTIG